MLVSYRILASNLKEYLRFFNRNFHHRLELENWVFLRNKCDNVVFYCGGYLLLLDKAVNIEE